MLAYWKIRGLVSGIRYQLKYCGVDFDNLEYEQGDGPGFSRDTWLEDKHLIGLDFPNLPYLLDGDHNLTETWAIHKYIASKWNKALLGNDPTEEGQIEMLCGVLTFIKNGVTHPCYSGKGESITKCIKQRVPALVKYLSDKKFLVRDTPCFVDFYWFELIELMEFLTEGEIFLDFPALKGYHHRVASLPGLKEYLNDPECIDKKRAFNNKSSKINNIPGSKYFASRY